MTYKDAKSIRQNPTAQNVDNQELSKMIDDAIEKQIPKKPIREQRHNKNLAFCQCCHERYDFWEENTFNYCCQCGQRLDWSE